VYSLVITWREEVCEYTRPLVGGVHVTTIVFEVEAGIDSNAGETENHEPAVDGIAVNVTRPMSLTVMVVDVGVEMAEKSMSEPAAGTDW